MTLYYQFEEKVGSAEEQPVSNKVDDRTIKQKSTRSK